MLFLDAKFSELFPDTKPTVASLVNASAPYERIIIGGECESPKSNSSKISVEVMQKFQGKSREVSIVFSNTINLFQQSDIYCCVMNDVNF
jgi:hypothetical protein